MTGSVIRALLLALAFCAPLAGAQVPVVVGAVVSQTGAHADLASDYARGLELWRDEANARGGLLGRQVTLRIVDDGSDASRARALYGQLIREKVDALIGPYGTAATLVAAAEAERAERVLVNGAGWSSAVHKRSPRYAFQSAVPYSAYGKVAVELARDAGYTRAVILARDDPASTEMASAATTQAPLSGLAAGEVQPYSSGAKDFGAFVTKLVAQAPQAWLVFGGPRDAAEIVRTFRQLNYAPKLLFVSGAADPLLLELLGQDAEYAIGASAFHASAVGAEPFVRAYQAKWSRPPGAAAAEGYAAGTVLAEAVRRAGSLEQRALRTALAAMETPTVLGGYKVDPASGEQVLARPVLLQIVLGKYQAVAPLSRATAKPVLPYPAWDDRQPLK